MQTDVLVIGGGPAGLATAIAAALRGLRVAVADPRMPPIDKACGEGLLPEGVASLHALGIELGSGAGAEFRGISFRDENSSASAAFSRGKAFGVRRTTLHRLLASRASELGVRLMWGARVSDYGFQGALIDSELIRFRSLVGADGQHSSVRKFAGLGSRKRLRARFGFRRHYAIAHWSDFVEVRWGRRGQMVSTPTGPEEVCISFFTSDPGLRIEQALAHVPDVGHRLRGAEITSAEAGAVTSLSRARAVVCKNVALVGDASCTVDGIAGQGLTLAFQQALALGEALASGGLAPYEAAHRDITRATMNMARLLLLMDASAGLRRKVLRIFAARPALFSKMMSIHTGESPASDLNAAAVLHLGWNVLWA